MTPDLGKASWLARSRLFSYPHICFQTSLTLHSMPRPQIRGWTPEMALQNYKCVQYIYVFLHEWNFEIPTVELLIEPISEVSPRKQISTGVSNNNPMDIEMPDRKRYKLATIHTSIWTVVSDRIRVFKKIQIKYESFFNNRNIFCSCDI